MPVSFTATVASAPGANTAANVIRDWRLDDTNKDLQLDATTQDAVFTTGTDAIIQDLESRFLTFQGEWFLDTSIGFPWFQVVLGQKLDEGAIRTAVTNEALQCPGVVSVDTVSVTFDTTSRTTTIVFTATTDIGAVITATLAAQQAQSTGST